jgi:large subunit ribosomal protein L10
MPNTQKIERVSELKERIEGSVALLLTEYRGLTVAEISELRRSLRGADTSFAVIKNTLMARAAADAGIEDLAALLSGPSAIAFVHGDPVAAAKAIKAASKLYPALVLKGGYLDGAVLDETAASRLADLESREAMLSKIAGLAKGEMSRAAGAFVAAQSAFLSLLEAFKEKVPSGDTAAEASEPEAGGDAVDADAPAETPDAAESAEPTAADDGSADASEEGVASGEPAEEATTDEAAAEASSSDDTDTSTEEE